jgi:four helix bundle protein
MAEKIFDLKRRTYRFALDVVKFLDGLPQDYVTRTIGQQLLRAGTSIGANVVEAQASSSKKDFANYYHHALKSANETKFWLGLLKDSGKVTNELIESLLNETQELSNILASSLLTIKGRKR